MFFALHLGDPDNQPLRRQKRSAVENGSCSFEMVGFQTNFFSNP
ncbi:unnamed protein product [Haemonchus placei]|uniref:PilS cassette n=1 Tax=Haemonchus placei TaxID=6290 RepID=A0A0N4W273_HAEPC|nr:unnamed protein product [Haemonchus placei]